MLRQCFDKLSTPAQHWGGENRSISDDFGDETDTTFVPCILLFSPKGHYITAQGVALGSC
jgi:hypothetical protein